MLYYATALALAVVGLLRFVRMGKRWEVGVIVLLAAMLSIQQSVFFVEGRHRWELEAILLVLTSGGLLTIAERFRPIAERFRPIAVS